MRVTIALDHRMLRIPDGSVWTQIAYPYSFWTRYLDVFTSVNVVTRIQDVETVPQDWLRVDGDAMMCTPIPSYYRPLQDLFRMQQVKSALRTVIRTEDAVILRIPSVQQIASGLEPSLRASGHPYAVEVVADPVELFSWSAFKHPLTPIFSRLFPYQMRRQIAGAAVASYVTEHALQLRYPPANGAFSNYFSDVELRDEAFANAPRHFTAYEKGRLTIITVGSLATLWKGTDILLEAFALCRRQGMPLRLLLVGDGVFRPQLEKLAQRHGIREDVTFLGQLPAGEAVRTELDRAHLFVMPSLSEGLPRAMLEAMARGLPCIGTAVGGIPELLASEDMLPPGDIQRLAEKLREVLSAPQRLTQMAERNLAHAQQYRDALLRSKRLAFLTELLERTKAWQKQSQFSLSRRDSR